MGSTGSGSAAGTWSTSTITCAAANGSGTATSEACTPSTNIPSGNYIFCAANTYNTGQTYSVTDSHSDTFTSTGAVVSWADGGSSSYQQLFWGKAGAAITSVTMSITAGSGSSNYPTIVCQTASDSGSSPALDGSQCYQGTTNSPYTCSSALTLAAQDYVVGFSVVNGSSTWTAGSGFTLGSTPQSTIQMEYGLFSTSVTPSITNADNNAGGILAAAFKP